MCHQKDSEDAVSFLGFGLIAAIVATNAIGTTYTGLFDFAAMLALGCFVLFLSWYVGSSLRWMNRAVALGVMYQGLHPLLYWVSRRSDDPNLTAGVCDADAPGIFKIFCFSSPPDSVFVFASFEPNIDFWVTPEFHIAITVLSVFLVFYGFWRDLKSPHAWQ